MMGRARSKSRQVLCTSISYFYVICLSAIFLVTMLMLTFRFLQMENPLRYSDPVLKSRNKDFEAQATSGAEDIPSLLRKLRDVPDQWDASAAHVWDSENAEYYYGCIKPSKNYSTSGGLNQQRVGITDSVVVARLLNATLVVPHFDHRSYWKDPSNFSDIFDVDWFIQSVAPDVTVIKELPQTVRKSLPKQVYNLRVPRKVPAWYYSRRIRHLLKRKHVLRLTKFDYRLANELETDLQKLRCRTNYKALRFTKSLQDIGQVLVDRMRAKGRRYIALHLRFESDMLAFSGCYYGGGERERRDLGSIRKRWKSLRLQNPERERRLGKCPLTPEEVGIMLRALGYGNNTYLYVASGDVYNGEASLAPLKALFPNFYTKELLANQVELTPFANFSSRMAAIDYIVCSRSDVFVANNNGNMVRILAGERRFNGHKRTIRPNVRKLGVLFSARHNMSWEDFAKSVRHHQKGFIGDPMEVKPGRGGFHDNPAACICEVPEANETLRIWREQHVQRPKEKELQAQSEVGSSLVIPLEDRSDLMEEFNDLRGVRLSSDTEAAEELPLKDEVADEEENTDGETEGEAEGDDDGDNY
ncbi:protein ROOT HAIR SPECIFIC 17 isoform X3 [Physcomitrium patens]|uniref:protein ROOT HAIR SPECIFIC 17 isoform X3 n=1 Tax=Physcomitrium patens TaxID=3218 RepID=UPI003CCD0B0D